MRFILTCLGLLTLFQTLSAQTDTTELDNEALMEQLAILQKADSLEWKTGTITLGENLANLQIPDGFRYLNPTDSRFVLVDLWGNPPAAADQTLGMIFPADRGPLSDTVVGFVLSFDPMGYVKDADADDSDFDAILKDLKKETEESNKFRKENGYPTISLVGWASAPYYDKSQKTLHWAKELAFDGNETNTLNYDARILGRKGVLSVNAVGSMSDLAMAKDMMPKLLSNTAFTEGNRYADYDSNVDEVAAYTIGGLVAGKVLAKAGFFALILKFIKPILIALMAFGTGIWRYISGKRKEEEE
jgi:uncharacterized membrane-anchored protein